MLWVKYINCKGCKGDVDSSPQRDNMGRDLAIPFAHDELSCHDDPTMAFEE